MGFKKISKLFILTRLLKKHTIKIIKNVPTDFFVGVREKTFIIII